MRRTHRTLLICSLAVSAGFQPGHATSAEGTAAADGSTTEPTQSNQRIIPTPAPPDAGDWSERDEVWLHRDRLHEGSYYVRSTRYRFGAEGEWHLIHDELERRASMPPGCERTPCLPMSR